MLQYRRHFHFFSKKEKIIIYFHLALAPTFEMNPMKKKILAAKGGRVIIECKPKAAPKPKFLWSKGTERLVNSSRSVQKLEIQLQFSILESLLCREFVFIFMVCDLLIFLCRRYHNSKVNRYTHLSLSVSIIIRVQCLDFYNL